MSTVITKLTAFFAAVSMFFCYVCGISVPETQEGINAVSRGRITGVNALAAGQGLCFDGEYWYTSGSVTALNITALAKWDENLRLKKVNFNAVPGEFRDAYGSNHIGGIDTAGGYIYAPVEGKTDRGYEYNFILLYDCETLEYTGRYFDMTSSYLTDGIPWCAVDEDAGYLYTSKYSGVTELLQYDLETGEMTGRIPLSRELTRIQGGSVYGGSIYLSYDNPNSTVETVSAVCLSDGTVTDVFTRNMCSPDNEAEDICVYPFPDGTLFHTLDYDKLIGVNITSFSPAVSG